ncbi:hypothetical protein PC115_g9026 [Phytophthora cactorum]|uniref:Uncharacterized protein n=1 Tax=Phytophthora cactorum TaxID=29920 RepID=A0A8T1CMS6_9STRA|nr:hypothetical protein PC115_g9026 [Phytophthora cactorum]KAG3169837.1 hypothetical protein C6341_g10977 [Phytophthora cactorum]
MSLTVRWLYTLEDPLVRLVNDGGLTRNTVSCSVHYVDVGMWASFSKSLAVLLRRTLWPVVEPDKSLVFFSNEVWVNKTIVECRLYRKLIVESLIQRTSARGFDGTTPPNQLCASADCRRLQLCVACGCFLRCCGGVGALLWKVQIAVKQWMSDAAWHF